ncbi:MAG: M48 family metalloprotease [Candidatus Riflebacteria bacterium]|nr:M48 family metalloprotease [Candidatus Riflebacteria bacterium]
MSRRSPIRLLDFCLLTRLAPGQDRQGHRSHCPVALGLPPSPPSPSGGGQGWGQFGLALGLLVLLALPGAFARPPANTARLPQEFEVHAPFPRRGMGPPRIPVYRNPDANTWVSAVFTRIASAADLKVAPLPPPPEQGEADRKAEDQIPDGGIKDKRRRGSTITILEWDIVNAFATPGEKLYVTTSLLEFVESDDELAGVIAHEIAHVRLNHIEKRSKRQMVSSLLFALATIQSGQDAFLAGQLMSQVPVLPYGQKQEMEADRVGLAYMKAAGYDANGVAAFLEKMAGLDKNEKQVKGVATIFNTHPQTPSRVAAVKKMLQEAGVPPGKPTHLSYDFKLERLSVDLSSLNLAGGGGPVTAAPDTPRAHGTVITSMRIAGNLVSDGDFDTDGQGPIEGWEVSGGTATLDREKPESGGGCLRLEPSGSRGVVEGLGPWIDVEPEQDYMLSGHVRAGDTHQRLSLGLRFYDKDRKALGTEFPAAWKVFAPLAWTRYQGVVFSQGSQFSLPAGVRSVRPVLVCTYTKKGPCWLDSLTLLRVGK